jgi:hypothetical protein
MNNQEILNNLIKQFGLSQNMVQFCKIAFTMYDIKYTAAKTESTKNEYEYDRNWWLDAAQQLTNNNEINRLIK